jgi:hypothetical protein
MRDVLVLPGESALRAVVTLLDGRHRSSGDTGDLLVGQTLPESETKYFLVSEAKPGSRFENLFVFQSSDHLKVEIRGFLSRKAAETRIEPNTSTY